MTNNELQNAIDSLLKYYEGKSQEWCAGGAPDGAASDVLGKLLYEQLKRATSENVQ